MQILVEETEYRRMQRIARRRGQSLAGWVRQALRAATREEPDRGREKKLAAVRAATAHGPTAPSPPSGKWVRKPRRSARRVRCF